MGAKKKKRTCKICKKELTGRAGQVFCSVLCKNKHHVRLKRITHRETKKIDAILHRNRAILLELLGKNAQKKISKLYLDKKKFNYIYNTSFHINDKGEILHHIYECNWRAISDEDILIRRKKQSRNS